MSRLQRVEERQATGPEVWAPLVERLLPRLSREVPGWAVLKNHAGLPAVTGDIDLCVPRDRWDAFLGAYLAALEAAGPFAVVVCDHYLGARFTFALPLDRQAHRVLQVDLMDGVHWKGARVLEAAVQLTCNALGRAGDVRPGVVRSNGVQAKAAAEARRKAMAHYRGFPRDVHGTPSAWLGRVSRGHAVHVVGHAPAWLGAGGGSR